MKRWRKCVVMATWFAIYVVRKTSVYLPPLSWSFFTLSFLQTCLSSSYPCLLIWEDSLLYITLEQDPPRFLKRAFIPLRALRRHRLWCRCERKELLHACICIQAVPAVKSGMVGGRRREGGGVVWEARILLGWRRNPAKSIFKRIEVCNTLSIL